MYKITQLIFYFFLFAFLSGCSQFGKPPINAELVHDRGVQRLSDTASRSGKRSDDLTLVLTFSGGGTRAAAFSYGVLEELKNTPMPHSPQVNMLDEVDLISSVSGGSFTAAYYGLYGDRIFHDYEDSFLKRPVQTSLLKHLLFTPSSWLRLAPELYDRSDLVADYYERNIFGKKRFSDIRPDSPEIVINATDLSTGKGFSFSDIYFRSICSELSSFSVGRAVVASSAVPVVFSPIALKNYMSECKIANYRNKYGADRTYQPYLHLVDGGVVDNLGIRSLLKVVSVYDDNFWKLMKAYGMTNNRRVAFIVVNASDAISPLIGKQRRAPDTATILGAVTTIQSSQNNRTTLNLLKSYFPKWKDQVVKGRCNEKPGATCDDIEFHVAELNFNQLSPELAHELSLVETSLELSPKTVDKLIRAGHLLFRQSPEVKQLLKSL